MKYVQVTWQFSLPRHSTNCWPTTSTTLELIERHKHFVARPSARVPLLLAAAAADEETLHITGWSRSPANEGGRRWMASGWAALTMGTYTNYESLALDYQLIRYSSKTTNGGRRGPLGEDMSGVRRIYNPPSIGSYPPAQLKWKASDVHGKMEMHGNGVHRRSEMGRIGGGMAG